MNEPWYSDGLKFDCTGCGDCCTGDPGYVWVSRAEIEALAAALGFRSSSSSSGTSVGWEYARA